MPTFGSHEVHPQPAGRLLTSREVAELLGVHTETVLRWTRKGSLVAIRLPGGALRYREDTLNAWLEDCAMARSQGVPPAAHRLKGLMDGEDPQREESS